MEPKRTYAAWDQWEGVGPHTTTHRLGVSNTTDRVYRVVHLFFLYERASEAEASGVVEMSVKFTESTGASATIALLRYTGNTVYDRKSYTLPNPIMLWKGDSLKVYTSDSSTGGTMNYWIAVVYEVI